MSGTNDRGSQQMHPTSSRSSAPNPGTTTTTTTTGSPATSSSAPARPPPRRAPRLPAHLEAQLLEDVCLLQPQSQQPPSLRPQSPLSPWDDRRSAEQHPHHGHDLIVYNPSAGCHGTYRQAPDGTAIAFHHCSNGSNNGSGSMAGPRPCPRSLSSRCGCLSRGGPGDVSDLPDELDLHRVRLVAGVDGVPYRLRPAHAAVLVMKLFQGCRVPDVLRPRAGMGARGRQLRREGEVVWLAG
ncbi:hypothetical protein GGR56DRAFT_682873 [Xylariaceae sp. FL0804]|nr:hypothetical protein GGR56DRAFT_682873 [Xylariaceae sp. FL0804]